MARRSGGDGCYSFRLYPSDVSAQWLDRNVKAGSPPTPLPCLPPRQKAELILKLTTQFLYAFFQARTVRSRSRSRKYVYLLLLLVCFG